ncbi:hypothetical protein Sar04_46240 [Salinispora arenicola]|uniref:Uncharacterized protein n=1 Tax=Salinispora arenicola TaxID=168697 RepID=A0ABQ4JY82_SALAC|nr:hypothetical protein Sar04_46240 [Salinispora arenicola]
MGPLNRFCPGVTRWSAPRTNDLGAPGQKRYTEGVSTTDETRRTRAGKPYPAGRTAGHRRSLSPLVRRVRRDVTGRQAARAARR